MVIAVEAEVARLGNLNHVRIKDLGKNANELIALHIFKPSF